MILVIALGLILTMLFHVRALSLSLSLCGLYLSRSRVLRVQSRCCYTRMELNARSTLKMNLLGRSMNQLSGEFYLASELMPLLLGLSLRAVRL